MPKVVVLDVYSFCRRMDYCVPGLSGGGVKPAAERCSECEVSVGMTLFEHCSPFCPCKGAWLGLDRPVEDGGSSAEFVGVAVFGGDLLAVGGGYVLVNCSRRRHTTTVVVILVVLSFEIRCCNAWFARHL